jgi:hypothetical protein
MHIFRTITIRLIQPLDSILRVMKRYSQTFLICRLIQIHLEIVFSWAPTHLAETEVLMGYSGIRYWGVNHHCGRKISLLATLFVFLPTMI